MRPQPDLPPRGGRRKQARRNRERKPGRARVVVITVLVVLFILAISVRGIAGFYTDYLWFESLGLSGVWRGVLGAKLSLSAIFTLLFFLIAYVNLMIADRLAPAFPPTGPEEDLIERYHEIIGHRIQLVRILVSAFFAVIAGASMGSHWNEWILFTHPQEFGVKDATFNTDVGFYVFRLPFITAVLGWLFAAIVVVILLTLVTHYLNGGIRAQTQLQRVTPQVKAHVSVLLAILALVKAGQYWFGRYQLTFSTRGTVDGATYTNANVELKAIYLLLMIALFATVLFLINIRRRGWVLPALAVGLWALVAVIAGEAVPQFVQRFRVEPAESSREAKYITNNIRATRQSYNLDVEDKEFEFRGDLTAAQLRENAGTVRNIRLWDPDLMRDSFAKLQGIRSFYAINDVDIDRYSLEGDTTQVMLSARDLKTSGVPQTSWEARHLTYTHGYGMILSPANAKVANGQPLLLAEDIPVKTSGGAPEVTRPEIYFGEGQSGYVIVNTERQEIDFQRRNTTEFTSYTGEDGIKIGSGVGGLVRKAAFALRFGDINPLISSNLKPESKVLVRRDIQSRLSGVAPFLEFDHDPYLVAVDGRLKYIVDGYTTTAHYPNAQRADTTGLDPESGLRRHRFNYVRNSVKAVVDAYDGSIRLYVVDEKDPLIKAYRSAFPKLFRESDQAPAALRAHFRYPEDLFTVQTQMWGKYHQDDPDTFYNGNDQWNVAQEAGINQLDEAAQAAVGPDGEPITPDDRYKPQYLLMRLPGEESESFLILRPFVPASSGDNAQKLLTAFMIAKSDPKEYGKLETYVMPSDNLPNGPSVVSEQMKSDSAVASEQTLLCQRGSECELRNLVLVPIENSILYVRSLYVRGDDSGTPELRRVVASYQTAGSSTRIEVAETLQGALEQLFPGERLPTTLEEDSGEAGDGGTGDDGDSTEGEEEPVTGTVTERENTLIERILEDLDEADRLAREGDSVGAAEKVKSAQDASNELQELRSRQSGSGSGTTTTTTPPRTTTTTAATPA